MELIFLLLLSAVMAWSMVRRPEQSLLRPVALAFIPLAIMLLPMAWNTSWMDGEMGQAVQGAWNQSVASIPVPEGENAAEQIEAWEKRGEFLLRFLPGSTGVFWLMILSAVAVLVRKFLVGRGKTLPAKPLVLWRSPDWLIWLFLAPAVVLLVSVNGWIDDAEGRWLSLGGNALLVTAAVYCFQGLQVMRWRMSNTKRPWIIWAVLAVTFLLLGGAALVSLAMTLAMVGIFDYWFDFRRILAPEEKKEP